jgi:4-amino-4-deoxy-L-arabinose transferase-like glycosyltransferase
LRIAEFGLRNKGQWTVMLAGAGIMLVLQIAFAGSYGIFRDEYYYLECARHLDWGYVDHPPLSIALLKLSVSILGDSLMAIRILPAICGAVLVFLIGLLASRMGGGFWAVLLACLATLVVPVYVINTGYFSMNSFELLLWTALFLILAQFLVTRNRILWLWFGIVLGLAFMNKIGVVALGVMLIPALLLGGNGNLLKRKEFWLGYLLAGLIFLPHVIWQIAHGWPTIDFISNASGEKIAALSLIGFFSEQIFMMNPILLPFWLLGLGALLFWRPLRPFRALGIIWVAVFLFFGLQRSKPYYLSPAYPPLLAAGAVAVASAFKARLRWMRGVVAVLMLAGGVLLTPLMLPILPPESLVRYMERVGIKPSAGETMEQASLPQYFADRFGWENMARTVADAYHALPESLKADCVIVTSNYGEAGALSYFRAKYGLPPAYSQHNSYFLWGTGDATGETILAVNYSERGLRDTYSEIKLAATVVSPWAMPYETDVPVYLCRGLKKSWNQAWMEGKLYL